MIKKIFLLIVMGAAGNLSAQDLHFYAGTTPVIDGVINAGEWDDADSCQITISASLKTTVRFKHDGTGLYFVYYRHLESYARFPELNLDINNSKSAAWESDDWWFHSSATDCDNNGAPGVYSDCALVQPDWESVPNFTSGGPNEDTVEMHIPFSKIGFVYSGGTDTIGIALDVSNTFSAWNMYPSTAAVNNPSTWTNGIFYSTPMGLAPEKKENHLAVYPNPVHEKVRIKINADQRKNVKVFDVSGQQVMPMILEVQDGVTIDLSGLRPGIYLVKSNETVVKLVKE